MKSLKIRSKITLLVVLPLIAVFAFAALAIVTTASEAVRADELRTMAVINAESGDLVSALQSERNVAVQTVTSEADDGSLEIFLQRIKKTDAAIESFNEARSQVSLPETVDPVLDDADVNLKRLESTRDKVKGDSQTAAAVAFAYRIPIADLVKYRESVPQAGEASPQVGDKIRASTQLLQSGEYQSLADVTVLRAIDKGALSELHYEQIVEAGSASDELRSDFNELADQQWRGWLESSRAGSKMIAAQALESEAVGSTPGNKIDVDKDDWIERTDYQAEKRKDLQDRIDADVVSAVSQRLTDQLWWTGGQAIAVLVTVILMVLLALSLGSPVVRGLRKLSAAARYVASEGLPKAVSLLDDHEKLGDRTPEEFAKEVEPPIKVQGRDELADVGRAFNEVHEEAVRIAAAQALLRFHIAAMFVRLARRGHSLAGRLTSVLDDAERTETDPQRLEQLFSLDHLVTLFGRTNDSLLVLGGAASSKVRRSSESVRNVLTAAEGQIEQYTRVDIGNADEEMEIKAGAVDDVVKVLAELLDNATQFSQSQVTISGWMLTDRLVIQIIDEGIGIEPETVAKLNTRLASKSALDLESVQTMGLTVVGHLAARYNLTVNLRANAIRGTLAEVTVPSKWLVRPSEKAQQPSLAEMSSKQPELFDKSKKAEKRRRNAGTWRRQPHENPAAPQTGPAPVPVADKPGAESLGAMLLPVIQFDSQTGSFPQVPSDPNAKARPATAEADTQPPKQRRPGLFQPGNSRSGLLSAPSSWASAQAAAETADRAGTGTAGLPKREPMAQLVPGAVETSTAENEHVVRRPDEVSATYLAFARGRASGRIENAAIENSRGAW